MTLRTKRHILGIASHGAVVFLCLAGVGLGEAAGSPHLSGLSALTLLGYSLTLRLNPLPRLVQSGMIGQAECHECGEVIDLVNTWSCGCGFVTWRPRHAFSPCPNCGKVFRWLVCPSCDASIPT